MRGKYCDYPADVTVIRRLDVLLEPTKDAVLAMEHTLDKVSNVKIETPLSRNR